MGVDSLDELLQIIERRTAHPVALLVGIDGAGGAGKSTFAAHLGQLLSRRGLSTNIVHIDDFYLPSAQRSARREDQPDTFIGADFDWQRLRDQVLLPLRQSQPAHYQRYDWGADALAEWHTVPARATTLVEGVYTLRRELRSLYNFTIWIDCPRPVRLARGIVRDGEQARATWEQHWMPEEDRYIMSHQPQQSADFIVANADPSAAVSGWLVRRQEL